VSLVAFANTDGGVVIVGMEDDEKPCGVDIGPETVQRYVNEIKNATYPQLIPKVLIEKSGGKPVLVFEVGEYPVKRSRCIDVCSCFRAPA
jgi:ATP-dependent DNA helicase RecG